MALLVELRKRLYDLSSKNKSLVHLRASSKLDADLKLFDFANGKSINEVVHFLFSNKTSYFLCPVQDTRSDELNALSLHSLKIARAVEQIEEESGVYELFVGWPYIEGKFQEGTSFRAPLLVFPVRLERIQNKWELTRPEKQIQFNHAFLLALQHYQNIKIPAEWFEEEFFDLDTFDLLSFKTDLINKLSSLNLDVRFERSFFEEQFDYFKSYLKDELNLKYANGAVCLSNELLLGVYPQSSSYLGPDYDQWIDRQPDFNIDAFFETKSIVVEDVYKEKIPLPYSLDASQEEVIKQVWEGKSIVIQGPPGSGKSETICNLVSSYIATGKKVLVVSQKRVALEVIHERLKSIGCEDFLAFVQDIKLDQPKLYKQLKAHIEQLEQYKNETSTFDVIAEERSYNQSVHLLERYANETNVFRNALIAQQEEGYIVKELYLQTDKNLATIDVDTIFTNYNKQKLEDLIRFTTEYEKYIQLYSTLPLSLWVNRKIEEVDIELLKKTYDSSIAQFNQLSDQLKLYRSIYPLDLNEQFIKDSSLVDELASLNSLDFRSENCLLTLHKLVEKHSEWLKLVSKFTKYQKLFESYSFDELVTLIDIYSKEKHSTTSIFKWWYHSIFNTEIQKIKNSALVLFGSKSRNAVIELEQVFIDIQWIIDLMQSIFAVPGAVKLTTIDTYNSKYNDLVNYVTQSKQSTYTVVIQTLMHSNKVDLKIKSDELNVLIKKFNSFYSFWNPFISIVQWNRFIERKEELKLWFDFVFANETDLHTLNLLCQSQTEQDRLLVNLLHAQQQDFNDVSVRLKNSIQLAWIRYYERKFPVLKTVGSISWESRFDDWSNAWKNKQKLSVNKILNFLKESTFQSLEYNRLNNRTTYRTLLHQVSKKRKVWSLRKLFDEFSEEILKLMPCWLMSPETVSLAFLQKEYFDLIVFDEASQCFVEQGLSAMLRAKQCVISGDSMQLQPNDLYQIRYENEEEESIELEQDSLMNLAVHYLPSIQLTGHYRSEYPSLIHFSNQYFYNNRLQFIPYQKALLDTTYSPLQYVNVQGVWENNVNKKEAEEIIDEIIRLVSQGITSIGVITFNSKQAQLIKENLYTRFESMSLIFPKSVFVKNIENVQGDERDYILFSVGYAPDLNGKFRMQFGSLNIKGGENRLNVAVTRAKKKVMVFASFVPSQLRSEQLLNQGGQLLKTYLEFVYENSSSNSQKFFEKSSKSLSVNSSAYKLQQMDTANSYEVKYNFVSISYKQNNEECLIDTDDHMFAQARSAKEWFLYKPLLMQTKGWKYQQVFSPILF